MNTTKLPLQLPDAHLDLGCGAFPRNPYKRTRLCGVDICDIPSRAGVEFKRANLTIDRIPFSDNEFGSVSACDFLEHVPRILYKSEAEDTILPFVNLMNEIWRVLHDGGLFYAITPAYPHHLAFEDPTHVNQITEGTHHYFTDPKSMGQVYGFRGLFSKVRVERVLPDMELNESLPSWRTRWRAWRWRRTGQLTHIAWELRAVKDI